MNQMPCFAPTGYQLLPVYPGKPLREIGKEDSLPIAVWPQDGGAWQVGVVALRPLAQSCGMTLVWDHAIAQSSAIAYRESMKATK